MIKRLFWKTFQADFVSQDGKQKNTKYYRGLTWEVVTMALDAANEKSDKEGVPWALYNLRKI